MTTKNSLTLTELSSFSVWYIRQWLKEKPFSLVHNDTEYPKKVFISFETEPTKEFLGTGDTFYSDTESGFKVYYNYNHTERTAFVC